MSGAQCPGQDKRFWKPEDIFEAPCPHCGARMEFWKDDVRRRCEGCGEMAPNPRLDLGCAAWCKYADKCLGVGPGTGKPADAYKPGVTPPAEKKG
jgi:hypothetical protein